MISAILDFFRGPYTSVLNFITWPAILCFTIAAIIYGISSDSSRIEQAKSWMTRIFIGIIVAYGMKLFVVTITVVTTNVLLNNAPQRLADTIGTVVSIMFDKQ